MKRRQSLVRRVRTYVADHDLIRHGESVVVGVSGGPDSTCLVHVLAELGQALNMTLHIAHLNHSLRGGESDDDARYVSMVARRLGIPDTVERRDVEEYRKEHGLSLEEAAREVRYSFFADVARAIDAKTVAVGHTADDQVETILMHIVRGTGLTGLRGMQPTTTWTPAGGNGVRIVRPLLDVRRQETVDYCAAHGLSPREDSSNLQLDFLRNRVRCELIPLLRSYNPNVDEAVLRAARAAADDLAYIDEEASRLWHRLAREHPDGVAIDRTGFNSLHPALKHHVMRAVLRSLLGDVADVESVHTEALTDAMAKPAGKSLSLPRGLTFHGGYGEGLITTGEEPGASWPAIDGEHRLSIPGHTRIPGWNVKSAVRQRRPAEEKASVFMAHLDLDAAGRELAVRRRRRGDRFQPLGMEGTKKLQDFMVDAKIPRYCRDRVPLVCSPDHVLWVVGWRIDHRVRVTPTTKQVVRLEFERA